MQQEVYFDADVLPANTVVYLLCKWPITSAFLAFAAVAGISFLSFPDTNSVAACSHFLFHSKPVCSFLSLSPPFSSLPLPPSWFFLKLSFPIHPSSLTFLLTFTFFPSSFPYLITFAFVPHYSYTSLPPLSRSHSPVVFHLSLSWISTHTFHSLFRPSILPTIPSFPLLLLLFLPPFGDSVAAGVGMRACLTEFCMRGLSNFYSDSKKRIRTSYQSKSSLPKGWGTVCLCAGNWGGWGSVGRSAGLVGTGCGLKAKDNSKRWLEWIWLFHICAVPYKAETPYSSHVRQYALCRKRATPLNLLSKGSYKYYMIHVIYILTDA